MAKEMMVDIRSSIRDGKLYCLIRREFRNLFRGISSLLSRQF